MLLIDEIDRADDEFEAFLLEFLADFAITIPELGTITASHRPLVVLTSNRTRELHDALEAPLPVPLDRLPDARARGRDRPRAAARRARGGRRARVRTRWRCCASASSTSCPAWGRRSRGRGRCWRSTATATLDDTLGVALKVREDIDRVRREKVLEGA